MIALLYPAAISKGRSPFGYFAEYIAENKTINFRPIFESWISSTPSSLKEIFYIPWERAYSKSTKLKWVLTFIDCFTKINEKEKVQVKNNTKFT